MGRFGGNSYRHYQEFLVTGEGPRVSRLIVDAVATVETPIRSELLRVPELATFNELIQQIQAAVRLDSLTSVERANRILTWVQSDSGRFVDSAVLQFTLFLRLADLAGFSDATREAMLYVLREIMPFASERSVMSHALLIFDPGLFADRVVQDRKATVMDATPMATPTALQIAFSFIGQTGMLDAVSKATWRNPTAVDATSFVETIRKATQIVVQETGLTAVLDRAVLQMGVFLIASNVLPSAEAIRVALAVTRSESLSLAERIQTIRQLLSLDTETFREILVQAHAGTVLESGPFVERLQMALSKIAPDLGALQDRLVQTRAVVSTTALMPFVDKVVEQVQLSLRELLPVSDTTIRDVQIRRLIADTIGSVDATRTALTLLLKEGVIGRSAGSALRFDGADDLGQIEGTIDLGDTWTLTAWVLSSSVVQMPILSNRNLGGSVMVGLTSGAATFIQIELSPAQLTGPTLINNGLWHHLVFVKTPTARRIYVDGVLDTSDSALGAESQTTDFWELAHDPPTNVFWNGSLDEVRMYNRALGAAEISAQYNAGQGHFSSPSELGGPVAAWHFDEGTGILTLDSSGAGHTMTLLGSPTWIAGAVAIRPTDFAVVVRALVRSTPDTVAIADRLVEFLARVIVEQTLGMRVDLVDKLQLVLSLTQSDQVPVRDSPRFSFQKMLSDVLAMSDVRQSIIMLYLWESGVLPLVETLNRNVLRIRQALDAVLLGEAILRSGEATITEVIAFVESLRILRQLILAEQARVIDVASTSALRLRSVTDVAGLVDSILQATVTPPFLRGIAVVSVKSWFSPTMSMDRYFWEQPSLTSRFSPAVSVEMGSLRA